MAGTLHLVKQAKLALARPVIERQSREPGATLTVVLLDDLPAPPLSAAIAMRHLHHDLGYAELLELIFASDHVVTW